MTIQQEPQIALRYPVVVHRRDGRYFLACPALGLIVENDGLCQAHRDIDRAIDGALDRYERAGIPLPAPDATLDPNEPSLPRQALPFAVKAAIVAALALGLVVALVAPLSYALQTARIQFRVAVQNASDPRELSNALIRIAGTLDQITPERREDLRTALRNIAAQLEPYAAEIRPLLQGPPPEIERPQAPATPPRSTE